MIIILGQNLISNDPPTRVAYFWISNGTDSYVYTKVGLPEAGNLQTVLNGMEAELWTLAAANGQLPTETETAIVEAVQFYIANPGTKADVFDKSATQLAADITAMVNASFPSASAAVKTGWIRTLMSSLFDTRVNAHDRDLV